MGSLALRVSYPGGAAERGWDGTERRHRRTQTLLEIMALPTCSIVRSVLDEAKRRRLRVQKEQRGVCKGQSEGRSMSSEAEGEEENTVG